MFVSVTFQIDDGYSAQEGVAAAQRLVDEAPAEVGAVLTFEHISIEMTAPEMTAP